MEAQVQRLVGFQQFAEFGFSNKNLLLEMNSQAAKLEAAKQDSRATLANEERRLKLYVLLFCWFVLMPLIFS